MDSNQEIQRQAVVFIHGMGEQRPMDTLRSFVKGVQSLLLQKDESEKNAVIRSKPDGISEIYETRRLNLSASRNRPSTDFYEFYWAHNMRDNKLSHFSSWLLKLIYPKKEQIPQRLRPIWKTIWALVILTIIFTASLLWLVGADKIRSFISTLVLIPTLVSILFFYIQFAFLNYIGDAGRYFTPAPSNVEERNNIRQQGIAFLKKMHQRENDEKYDRIIVVAHSLGSVIAYDLLRLYWTELNETFEKTLTIDQSAIDEIENYSRNKEQIKDLNLFQNQQYQCWEQQRNIGNKWLISDFITIGSPLSHANFLIVNNVSFDDLKIQREFPTCPPVADIETKKIHYTVTYEVENGKRSMKILHHAALFAVTRWTNIFFTSDFVGGPIKPLFGQGIKDIGIKRKSLWFYPGGHTNYWDTGNNEALEKIVNALNLRTKHRS